MWALFNDGKKRNVKMGIDSQKDKELAGIWRIWHTASKVMKYLALLV